MKKTQLCFVILLSCILSAFPGCRLKAPILSPGEIVSVTTETIEDSGGTITVAAGDENIDGLSIEVPADAFEDSQTFTVSYRSISSHTLPEDALVLTPLVGIDNGNTRAQDPVKVVLPAEVPEGYFAMAFYYDEAGNRLEGMRGIEHEGSGVAFVTRHFSEFIAIALPRVSQEDTSESAFIETGFKPGIDDWQFKNRGSWIAPDGHCAGQSMMALYYYTEKKLKDQAPQLNGRYDNDANPFHMTPTLQHDDVLAYRLCSVAQEDLSVNVDIYGTTWHDKQLNDLETYNTFSLAMLISGEPQFVVIYRKNAQGKTIGHAMVVYKESRRMNAQNEVEGVLHISDPNYPGQEREIVCNFTTKTFAPYHSGPNADDLGKAYPDIYFKEKRDLFDPAVDGKILWDAFEGETIGRESFPDFTVYLCKRNADYTRERLGVVTESFAFTGSPYDEYCFEVVGDGFTADWEIYKEDGTLHKTGTSAVDLKEGITRLGIHVRGEKAYTNSDGEQATKNKWVGFSWANINFTSDVEDVVSTTTTTIEEVDDEPIGFDLSAYNCVYMHMNAVSLCSNTDWDESPIYTAMGQSWGGDENNCPPAGSGSYTDGVFTSSSESWNLGIRIQHDITINFNTTGELSIHSLSATNTQNCADESLGCYGVVSQSFEISAFDIPCKESGGTVYCNIAKGEDLESHIASYAQQQSWINFDDENAYGECSSLYNDYTLVPNEFFHDRLPVLDIWLRTAQE